MWYDKYTFYKKQKRLIDEYPEINLQQIWNNKLPTDFFLPDELLELLQFSNGGGIINGNRDFGYFSLIDMRNYYFDYKLSKYTPLFLPVAFNGGGIFYAYDFRDPKNIRIVAADAGDLEYESSIVIGETLDEVLSKTNDIVEELDKIRTPILFTEDEKQIIELRKQLAYLNANRNSIDTKSYLLAKRKLESQIKQLKFFI
ncbi:SMI1/KNR4 family protein [Flavobacterium sp. AC]|uniref:SMI1/KNR4 family protein n=1 Tax=Flavobacterium azizsancarii TaxID=2961580 RepID=A0ABT4WFF9_9FLAO|nr:SMI1/KNR4 family protein [Flavobacterium azizsancarii]MDA6071217.1 SMI1/KNR4 family protein [Flavobacterium azizsancarii]